HYQVYLQNKVLLQGISENNLMFKCGTDGHIKGILNDWDIASHDSELICGSQPRFEHRIPGTIPLMARDLLVDSNPPPHLYRHDLESFFYILVWASLNYDFGADEPSKLDLDIAEWDADTLRNAKALKSHFICDPDNIAMILERVQPTCRILLPWIDSIWFMFNQAQSYAMQNHRNSPKDWDHETQGGRITFQTFMKALGPHLRRETSTESVNDHDWDHATLGGHTEKFMNAHSMNA
ncbi:hypothetical protein H0H93_013460, partial [Arthromyces matolae]